MQDKEEPATTGAAQAGTTGDGSTAAASAGAGDGARSTSASPPPPVPAATKPSALVGQSATSLSPPATGVQSSPSPAPESLPTNPALVGQDAPINPQIASLKAIFPDYDEAILYVSAVHGK